MTQAPESGDRSPGLGDPLHEVSGPASGAVRLRPLLAADVPRVTEIERELFGPSAWSAAMVAGELQAPGRWYLAAVEGVAVEGAAVDGIAPDGAAVDGRDAIVGYAGLWFDGDVTQVMTIGVAPTRQRRGVGARLLTALVGRSRELGASAVLLEVRVGNAPAMALYERFGFAVLARRRRYYQPEDADAWTMRLDLAAPDDARPPGGSPDSES